MMLIDFVNPDNQTLFMDIDEHLCLFFIKY